MPRFTLSRRAFLRGATAGGLAATVGLPVLEAMLDGNGTAYSGGLPLTRRLICVMFGNGVLLDRWVPAIQGPDYVLPDALASLEDLKESFHVLSGFENRHLDPTSGHREGMCGMWAGHRVTPDWKFSGPTVDQLVAKSVGSQTAFRSLQLGISKRMNIDEGASLTAMSHRGPDQPLPPETNPQALFRRVFGLSADPASAPSRVSVLDAVREDTQALEARLGQADRLRLDAHLEGVAQLQAQIASIPPSCAQPSEPSETNTDENGLEPMESVSDLMIDLLGYALSCDLTRVASLVISPPQGRALYHFLGQQEENHVMSHDPVTYAEQLHASTLWNVDRIGTLLRRLRDTDDGTGTLLSNSLVLCGSDVSTGNHTLTDLPILVAGGGGGLLRPGLHLRAQRNVSDLLLTCAQVMVPAIRSVGSDEMLSETPFTEILV